MLFQFWILTISTNFMISCLDLLFGDGGIRLFFDGLSETVVNDYRIRVFYTKASGYAGQFPSCFFFFLIFFWSSTSGLLDMFVFTVYKQLFNMPRYPFRRPFCRTYMYVIQWLLLLLFSWVNNDHHQENTKTKNCYHLVWLKWTSVQVNSIIVINKPIENPLIMSVLNVIIWCWWASVHPKRRRRNRQTKTSVTNTTSTIWTWLPKTAVNNRTQHIPFKIPTRTHTLSYNCKCICMSHKM